MTRDYFGDAQGHIDEVCEATVQLDALHRSGGDKRQIAALYDDVRQGLKLAEVSALLYIGDRLDAVVRTLDAHRLTDKEIAVLTSSCTVCLGEPGVCEACR